MYKKFIEKTMYECYRKWNKIKKYIAEILKQYEYIQSTLICKGLRKILQNKLVENIKILWMLILWSGYKNLKIFKTKFSGPHPDKSYISMI